MGNRLDDEEIARRLPEAWEREDDEIVRAYAFDDYLDGVTFATRVAEVADAEFHHPEIRIGYEEVEVRLTSHEEGGVTEKDLRLAAMFDEER